MNKKKQAQVFHFDLFGSRNDKYDFLNNNSIGSIAWNNLEMKAPNLFFTKKDFQAAEDYEKGFKVDELYLFNGAGVQTKRDNVFVGFDESSLTDRMCRLLANEFSENELKEFNIKNSSSYRLLEKIEKSEFENNFIRDYNYRVFDNRKLYYDNNLLGRAFYKIMQHMLVPNIGLILCKQQSSFDFQHCFITKDITDHNSISLQTKEASYFFPLYLNPVINDQQTIDQQQERVPNLNLKIVQQLAKATGLTFTPEVEDGEFTFAPIEILDYIYAVLHSPAYRAKYKEFLKIDFPRVPYPKNKQHFWHLVELGGQLREIHLLESRLVEQHITTYPEAGTNEVEKPVFKMYDYDCTPPGEEHPDYLGDVYINSTQYFAKVPQSAWEFYIGGYQPAQKWLKDRKGRTLTFHDIEHYQKIIVALTETGRLMKDIDLVGVE
nr:type ISP restriction/modification enzyme [uncultured Draconibacterium sp.]